jgi:hypothetical protein
MRKGVVFLAPFFLATAAVVACGTAAQRSAFVTESDPTEEAGVEGGRPGFGNNMAEDNNDGGCSSSQTEITRTPLVIEFIVDESGSMNDAPSKWEPARDALLAAFEDMNVGKDPSAFIGLELFSTRVNTAISPDSLASPGHYDDLVDAIDKPKAKAGGTGSLNALAAGYEVVETFKPPASSGLSADEPKRVVVFLSDGVPGDGTPEQAAVQQPLCEQLVTDKFAAGPILTFSIGVGPFPGNAQYDPAFMGRLAISGGTAPPGCVPQSSNPSKVCHFQITPGDDVTATKQAFLDAINQIRALTASCEFGFKTTGNSDLNKIEVTITNKDGSKSKVKKDPDNGWTFDDPKNPTKVILHGKACAASSGTVLGKVDVVLGCRGAN